MWWSLGKAIPSYYPIQLTASSAGIDWFDEHPTNKATREKIAQCVRSRLDTIGVDWTSSGAEVKMLDYACGDGFLSRIFAPYVSSIAAIDVSPVMVKKYNARVDELGLKHAKTQAVMADLVCDPPSPLTLPNEGYHDFHLITVGAALCRFSDTEVVVRRLAERLRPGGVLFIQDIFDDGHRDGEEKQPQGFTLDEVRSIMSNAGLVDFRFEVLLEELEIEAWTEVLKVKCFLARGLKREQ